MSSCISYHVTISNRKAKENERLGNEDEVKRFQKLLQLLCTQAKPTVTLLLIGGIDVIGNILIPFLYAAIGISVDLSKVVYFKHFLMYPLSMSLLLSHPLVYGLYMKKIRRRLPNCTAYCQMQCNIGLSQICSKSCPKCFWNIPKVCTYYALHASHYACIMLQYEQH